MSPDRRDSNAVDGPEPEHFLLRLRQRTEEAEGDRNCAYGRGSLDHSMTIGEIFVAMLRIDDTAPRRGDRRDRQAERAGQPNEVVETILREIGEPNPAIGRVELGKAGIHHVGERRRPLLHGLVLHRAAVR